MREIVSRPPQKGKERDGSRSPVRSSARNWAPRGYVSPSIYRTKKYRLTATAAIPKKTYQFFLMVSVTVLTPFIPLDVND